MHVINLFGPPGVGKSTVAAETFSMLKKKGVEVELCTEFAKSLVWEGRSATLQDNLYVFSKQNAMLVQLARNGIDYAVTDSPLPICLAYTREGYYQHFRSLVMEVFHDYKNINFYLSATHRYSRVGRIQNEEESRMVDKRLREILNEEKIEFVELASNHSTAFVVIEHLKSIGMLNA